VVPNRNRRGSTLVEFALIGITLLFAWISIIEMSRGMWNYHSLQAAIKIAGGYTALHGATCAEAPNACTIQVKDILSVLRANAIGIPPASVNVTFTSASGTTKSCNPITTCAADTTQWPPVANGDNAVGKDFTIRADYTFRSALAMVAPGPGGPVRFGVFNLPAYTRQFVLF
jgi:Flp pilus assembly protein TadG